MKKFKCAKRQNKRFNGLNKRFISKFDVLGSYTGTGEGYSKPEVDVDDL